MALNPSFGSRMNMWIRALVLSFASLLPVATGAQDAGVLHLQPLHLELPATWTFNGTQSPIEGTGPEGEKVLITVMRRKPAPAEGGPSVQDVAQGFAGGPMAQLAAKNGMKVIRQVSAFPTPEGKVGFSAASEATRAFGGKSYFIQYLLSSPGALIYLTFEGKGEAGPAMLRFDKFLETQRWDD